MEFQQKKLGTRINISLEEKGINYSIKDKQASNSAFVRYDSIPNEKEYFKEKNTWFLYVGILWSIIGFFELQSMLKDGINAVPLWFTLGIISLAWYFFSKISYTTINTFGTTVFIMKDKQHDKILESIYKARNEYLKKTHDVLGEVDPDFIEGEIAKFEWLYKLEIITTERLEEVKNLLSKKKKL